MHPVITQRVIFILFCYCLILFFQLFIIMDTLGGYTKFFQAASAFSLEIGSLKTNNLYLSTYF